VVVPAAFGQGTCIYLDQLCIMGYPEGLPIPGKKIKNG